MAQRRYCSASSVHRLPFAAVSATSWLDKAQVFAIDLCRVRGSGSSTRTASARVVNKSTHSRRRSHDKHSRPDAIERYAASVSTANSFSTITPKVSHSPAANAQPIRPAQVGWYREVAPPYAPRSYYRGPDYFESFAEEEYGYSQEPQYGHYGSRGHVNSRGAFEAEF